MLISVQLAPQKSHYTVLYIIFIQQHKFRLEKLSTLHHDSFGHFYIQIELELYIQLNRTKDYFISRLLFFTFILLSLLIQCFQTYLLDLVVYFVDASITDKIEE